MHVGINKSWKNKGLGKVYEFRAGSFIAEFGPAHKSGRHFNDAPVFNNNALPVNRRLTRYGKKPSCMHYGQFVCADILSRENERQHHAAASVHSN